MSDLKTNTTTTMISNVVRSLAIAGAFLPLSLAVGGAINSAVTTQVQTAEPTALEIIEKDLSRDCFRWMSSKEDTVVEKDSESKIDKYMGGPVDYESVCDWVLN